MHREKLHHHLMLTTEAGLFSTDPFTMLIETTRYGFTYGLLAFRDRLGLRDQIDIVWCISEGLRGVIVDLFAYPNWAVLHLRLALIADAASGSERKIIYDGFLELAVHAHIARTSKKGTSLQMLVSHKKALRMLTELFGPSRRVGLVAKSQMPEVDVCWKILISQLKRYRNSAPWACFPFGDCAMQRAVYST